MEQLTDSVFSQGISKSCDGQNNNQALAPVIGIHLLNFDLFDAAGETHQAHRRFEMRGNQNPQTKLSDELQLHIIKLPAQWQEKTTMQTIPPPGSTSPGPAKSPERRCPNALPHLNPETAQRLQTAF